MARGSEDVESGVAQIVGQARDERSLGADDDQLDVELLSQRHDGGVIAHVDAMVDSDEPGSRVARGDMELADVGITGQSGGEGVFAPAGSQEQN